MKLSVWAKKQGISYITAWRWFNEGRLPVKAYRSDSGTIIVQDESESSEQVMGNPQSSDVMTTFFLKTVEFSKNNRTIEEFAAWVMSTFTLKFNTSTDSPKYSRVKPKSEDIQKHFQQFMKKGEKPKPQAFVATEEALAEIVRGDGLGDEARLAESLEVTDGTDFVSPDPELNKSLSELFVSPVTTNFVSTHDGSTGGIVTRSVDSTPQLNYTGSTNNALGSNFSSSTLFDASQQLSTADAYFGNSNPIVSNCVVPNNATWTSDKVLLGDQPTFKAPARRGRKPAKSFGK